MVRRVHVYIPLLLSICLCIVGAVSLSVLFYTKTPYILVTITDTTVGIGRLELVLNPVNAVFLLSFVLVGVPVAFYNLEYLVHHHRHEDPRHYWFYLSISYFFTLLYFLSNNFLVFLFSLDAMIVFLGLLIAFDRTYVKARTAARTYIVMGLLASALITLSLSIIFIETRTFSFTELREKSSTISDPLPLLFALILGLIGFSIKSGVVPFHSWLPLAHGEAPTPISALLSGFIVGTGIYGLLMLVTSIGLVNEVIAILITLLGLVSVIYGAVMALAQDDIKKLLAYSTICYMGYTYTMISTFYKYLQFMDTSYRVVEAIVLSSILLFLLNHSIAKATLFLIAGNIISHIGTRDINKMGGLYKEMKLDYIALLLASIVFIGLPPTTGFQSKILYHTSILGIEDKVLLLKLSITVFSTILTTSYLLKLLYKGFRREAPHTRYYRITARHGEKIPELMTSPLYILIATAFITGLWRDFILSVVKSSAVYRSVPVSYLLDNIIELPLVVSYAPYTSTPVILAAIILAVAVTPLSLLIGFWFWTHIEEISYEFHRIANRIYHIYILGHAKRILYSIVGRLEVIEDNYWLTLTTSLVLLLVILVILLS